MPTHVEWAEQRLKTVGEEHDKLFAELKALREGGGTPTRSQERALRTLTNQLAYAKTVLENEEAVQQERERYKVLQDSVPFQDETDKDAWFRKRLARYPLIRQESLRELIGGWTHNGQDIAKVMLAILYDDPLRLPERVDGPEGEPLNTWPRNRSPNITERMAAADWLATRLWGRPVVVAKIESTERKQLELVWGDAGLPERDNLPEDERLIEPIEAEFRVDGNAENSPAPIALRAARRSS